MTDSNDKKEKAPLTLSRPKLELKKPVDAGRVHQNLGTGRSRSVQVEVRKKRSFVTDAQGNIQGVKENETSSVEVLDSEKARRLKVLKDAIKEDEENRIKAEEEAKIRAIEEEKRKAEEAKRRAEEEAERKRREAEQAVVQKTEKAAPAVMVKKEDRKKPAEKRSAPVQHQQPAMSPEDAEAAENHRLKNSYKRREFHDDEMRGNHSRRGSGGEEKWRGGRMNMSALMRGDDEEVRGRSLASIKRAREKERQKMSGSVKPAEKVYREVIIPETITVQELASRMSERGADVVKQLMKMGVMATITQTIDADIAQIIVEEMGHKAKRVNEADVEDNLRDAPDPDEDTLPRPPVVPVMGHVDHGKTSLLDNLRSTDVAAHEAGGITQHIGAYQITLENGQKVTFIDTPGHAAFTEMRARGAKVTDSVVLVVAANDGIMPQTIEAITHAKAAGVPIVVAINKIDVPGANPEKVRTDLLSHEVVVESMGGDVLAVEVSAKKRINLDKLVEAILLQAEILDLKANPNHMAEGAIIEAKMEKGRGSVATVLVQRGTLHQGDIFVAGKDWGRVRAMVDEHGQRVTEAGPSFPVEVLGFQSTPSAGDDFIVVNDEDRAREVAAYRQRKEREALQVRSTRSAMEQMFDKIKSGEAKELPVVIKADVQGSVEALTATLNKISTDKAKVRILHAAVGAINESDVTLAKASSALIIGFNVRANTLARTAAKRDGIEIRYHSIIYNVADDIHAALEGMLAPELHEKILGYAKIRQVYNISKVGKVAGCMVKEGLMKRGAHVRLLRSNVVYHDGMMAQLKRFKDDVKEVREGYECGMSFENFNDIQVDDTVECYEIEEVAAKLEDVQL
ncbi:MAG: translation initiation factor IF-2 [Alphaproteobacteria bacterium]|nr:translation initiation factor IF-2 [Alphaproteobacteria bacterium]